MNPISKPIGKLRDGTRALTLVCLFSASGYIPSALGVDAVWCTNCATKSQQSAEYAKAVQTALNTAQQLATQLDQYNDMVLQGLALPERAFAGITSSLEGLRDVYNQGRTIAYSVENLSERFREQFAGYESYLESFTQGQEDLPSRYRKWAEEGFDNARTALTAVGIQTSAIADEEATLRELVNRSATAQGRMQAIQAGNEIAAQQVQQLQKLREMMATSITMQANYIAQQTEQRAVDDAVEEFRNVPVKDDPVAENKRY